jgi:hypothetical protein
MSSFFEKNLNLTIELVTIKIFLSEFGIIAVTGVDIWSLMAFAVYLV